MQNLDCRIAGGYEQFISGSDLELLMADLFKFSLRRALDLPEGKRLWIKDVEQMQVRVAFSRKVRRNGNGCERVLIEVHGTQNVTKSGHSHPF